MASLKELHKLVHSLNKSEKKHISLFVKTMAGKAEKNYAFQIKNLLKNKNFDKVKVNDNQKRFLSGNVSEFNTNLYEFILKGLMLIRSNNQNTNTLKEIIKTNILIEKGLIQSAEKRIDFNIKKIEEFGPTFSKSILQEYKYKISIFTSKSFHTILDVLNKQITLSEQFATEKKFIELNYRLSKLFVDIDFPRNEKEAEQFNLLLENQLFRNETGTYSNYGKHYYYMVKIPLLFALGKNKEALLTSQNAVGFVKETFNKKIDVIPIVFQLRRYLNALLSLKLTDKIKDVIAELETFIPYLEHKQQLSIWSNILDAYLWMYIVNGNYEKGLQFFEIEAKEKFDLYFDKLTRLDSTALLISRLYFLNEKYEESLAYAEIALSGDNYKFFSTTVSARCLLLLNHYKLENNLLLPYQVKSLYRSLKKAEVLYEPEKTLLQFLGKLKHPDGLRKNLKTLKEKFSNLSKNPFNNTFFNNGDYFEWIDTELNS